MLDRGEQAAMGRIPRARWWNVLADVTTPQDVSTLTTLLAFTSYGETHDGFAVHLENLDGANDVALIVEVSHNGSHPNTERTQTHLAHAGEEVTVTIDPPNPFTYIRITAQTNSPGFPTVQVKWALLGLLR
ncbi:MAG TPA: hypothetical protein PK948_04975 [Gemmatimonadales bacterium]|nr:hypothetical protein [Gemmatimonadales bacterium]